jgi:hypothetical protein
MENSFTDRVKNEVLQRVKIERNIVSTINRTKANWIGHVLRSSFLLRHVIEGRIDGMMTVTVTGREGRRRKRLLDYYKGTRGYWKLTKEVLDCSLWRTHFGIGYGPVVRLQNK